MKICEKIITNLIDGIEIWASDEDGVHYKCWDAYKEAMNFLGIQEKKPAIFAMDGSTICSVSNCGAPGEFRGLCRAHRREAAPVLEGTNGD